MLDHLIPTGVSTLTCAQTRPTLAAWGVKTAKKDDGRGIQNYRVKNNVRSLDGLPGLRAARRDHGEVLLLGDMGARARRVGMQWGALLLGIMLVVALIWMGWVLGVVEIGINFDVVKEMCAW